MNAAQRIKIHSRITDAWESMGAVMTLAFLDECIEIVEDVLHPEPLDPRQERIEETKDILKRYLGDDTPQDVSNMASNIAKIWEPR